MTKSPKVAVVAATSAAPPFVAPIPDTALMWALGHINRWLLIRHHFRVAKIDLPRRDVMRLHNAVNESTAAFLAPNHPEFGFDWMMDKELSTHASPRMASWAAHEIIASAPWFWRRNNLIANNGGEAAAEYSVKWALRGKAVLAHPEGMVHWNADKIHPLFSGVADMAIAAARRDPSRPAYIVPLVWKLQYTADVSDALHREMNTIESALGLASGRGRRIAERFAQLQGRILSRQMARFGFEPSLVAGLDFFNKQSALRAYLVAGLQSKYRVQLADSTERTINRLNRAIAAQRRETPQDNAVFEDSYRVKEAERLGGFSRDVYGTSVLSQEQIGESLKRIRATLMRRGMRNSLHNSLPTPFGSRIAHVRVPEPLRIDTSRISDDATAYVAELIQETRARMQNTLEAINAEIAAEVMALSHPNPFVVAGVARAA